MAREKPKKPRKPKRRKLTLTKRDKWKKILSDIEKAEAPVTMLQGLTVNLIDGTSVDIDVQELLNEGYDPEELELHINSRLDSLDELIENVDFFINIDNVADVVQPVTDALLKNL